MRIAFLITSLGIGGAERQVVALAERMAARGHAVLIVVIRPRAAVQWSTLVNVVHLDIRKTLPGAIVGTARAARVLRGFRPDILHCHNFHGNMLGRLLKLALLRAAVISTIHNVYEGGWMRMAAYRTSDRLSERTVAVCEAAAQRMIEVGAVPKQKCAVIANGIDPGEFAPDPERRQRIRRLMGINDDAFLWMSAGRLAPAKDYENLLRAFAEIRATEGCGELWIAGEGTGEYVRRIRSLADELGLEKSIRWLGLRRDIPALLDAADGFVLSSAWEGMPLALGEAMAMQKAVVATDVGGVRELVGNCGIVVPPGNYLQLAAGMRVTMSATTRSHAETGRLARRRVLEYFNIDVLAEAWEAMYRSASPRQ